LLSSTAKSVLVKLPPVASESAAMLAAGD